MEDSLKDYEKRIKKTHKFGFTPKYQESIRTNLKKRLFVAIAVEVFEKLEWDVVFVEGSNVEAKRKNSWNKWTEKIALTYSGGNVIVKSSSLGNEMWDNGRNSKRVKLFIYAFEQTERDYDAASLESLEKELERKDNWDDYTIPEKLPQPKRLREPQIAIPIIGGIVIALITGFILAFLTFKGTYVIFLFELGAALLIAFALKYLIRLGNYTNLEILNYLLMGIILITYISNQYFLYRLILNASDYSPVSFLDFIKIRLEAGLKLDSLNLGWIGLVLSWIFQLVMTYLIAYLRMASSLTFYMLGRVPNEVVEFAAYHLIKGKSEEQVRHELFKMMWKDRQSQDEAFEAIAGFHNAQELSRMD